MNEEIDYKLELITHEIKPNTKYSKLLILENTDRPFDKEDETGKYYEYKLNMPGSKFDGFTVKKYEDLIAYNPEIL